jgi:RNA polymerase sigma-70 factor, ECF subfamily
MDEVLNVTAGPDRRSAAATSMAAHDFDAVYAASYARLVSQVYAYCGDLGDAQDIVQEAFARAWTRWSRISGYHDPVAWLRTVAWNLATSRWRRSRVALRHLLSQREETVAPPGPERVALSRALATLPPRLRRVMVLRYLADLPITEIAVQEGVPEGTVRSWLHRARAALATQLTDVSPEQEGYR